MANQQGRQLAIFFGDGSGRHSYRRRDYAAQKAKGDIRDVRMSPFECPAWISQVSFFGPRRNNDESRSPDHCWTFRSSEIQRSGPCSYSMHRRDTGQEPAGEVSVARRRRSLVSRWLSRVPMHVLLATNDGFRPDHRGMRKLLRGRSVSVGDTSPPELSRVAAEGRLEAGRLTTQGLADKDTLFDFNEMAFAPIEAPY